MADNDGAPNPGGDDCYNRVTQTCNARHPGKNWGDKVYRDCITDGLDWCDVNEASQVVVVPGMNGQGRLTKRNAFARFWAPLFGG